VSGDHFAALVFARRGALFVRAARSVATGRSAGISWRVLGVSIAIGSCEPWVWLAPAKTRRR
jgi:hypothetical protein